jgi:hypothetical protein
MSWLAGTAQRLKRVFSIDITEFEKCQGHDVIIIACIIDIFVIQKLLAHFDKKSPESATPNLLPPMRAPPPQKSKNAAKYQLGCIAPRRIFITNILSSKVGELMLDSAKICLTINQNNRISHC